MVMGTRTFLKFAARFLIGCLSNPKFQIDMSTHFKKSTYFRERFIIFFSSTIQHLFLLQGPDMSDSNLTSTPKSTPRRKQTARMATHGRAPTWIREAAQKKEVLILDSEEPEVKSEDYLNEYDSEISPSDFDTDEEEVQKKKVENAKACKHYKRYQCDFRWGPVNQIANICMKCHTLLEDESFKPSPAMNNIFGRLPYVSKYYDLTKPSEVNDVLAWKGKLKRELTESNKKMKKKKQKIQKLKAELKEINNRLQSELNARKSTVTQETSDSE
jgi:cytochrome c2